MNKVIDKFNSFSELLSYANTSPHLDHHSNTGSSSFCGGTNNLAEAVKLATEGWHDERDALDRMLRVMQDQIGERFQTVKRSYNSVHGSRVDMGRFLGGRPDHMVAYRKVATTSQGKICRLILDYGANGSTSADDMLKRGVTITALVDLLATMGISIELWGETTVKVGSDQTHTTLVQMHDPREPLDIDSLMYAIAHPAMLRRLTFSVREKWSGKGGASKMSSHGHGTSIPITFAEELQCDVVLNRIEHGGNNDIIKKPVEWIMQTIKGLGLLD
jgi:hypothetical protein